MYKPYYVKFTFYVDVMANDEAEALEKASKYHPPEYKYMNISVEESEPIG